MLADGRHHQLTSTHERHPKDSLPVLIDTQDFAMEEKAGSNTTLIEAGRRSKCRENQRWRASKIEDAHKQ